MSNAIPAEVANVLNPLIDIASERDTRNNVASVLKFLGAANFDDASADGGDEYARTALMDLCAAALKYDGYGAKESAAAA